MFNGHDPLIQGFRASGDHRAENEENTYWVNIFSKIFKSSGEKSEIW